MRDDLARRSEFSAGEVDSGTAEVQARETTGLLALLDRGYDLEPAASAWQPLLASITAELGLAQLHLFRGCEGSEQLLASSDPRWRIGTEGVARGLRGVSSIFPGTRIASLLERGSAVAVLPWGGDAAPGIAVEVGSLGRGAAEDLRVVGRHLARAWVASAARAAGRRCQELLSGALDRLSSGVLVVDSACRLLEANASARELLARRDGLEVCGGLLRPTAVAERRRFAALLERGSDASVRPGSRGSQLRLQSPGRRVPLELLVLPLRPRGACEACRVSVVFVTDPERFEETPADFLRHLFGLTAAEGRVATQILRGRSVSEAACELKVKRETVRSHLKRVFAKVGTTRQSDLVRLLIAGPSSIRWN